MLETTTMLVGAQTQFFPRSGAASFKRLLGSGLVRQEIPEAMATDGGITVEWEPSVAGPVTPKGLAVPHASEHGSDGTGQREKNGVRAGTSDCDAMVGEVRVLHRPVYCTILGPGKSEGGRALPVSGQLAGDRKPRYEVTRILNRVESAGNGAAKRVLTFLRRRT